MPEEAKDSITALQPIIEWALKLGPSASAVILFIVTLYTNQGVMLKHDVDVDNRLTKVETRMNEESRVMIERLAHSDAAVESLKHELDFYMQTLRK